MDFTFDLHEHIAEKGRKVVAHFCSYTPEEIIHAAGLLPVRVFGAPTAEKASTHLQSYCCSYAKRALEQGLTTPCDGSVFVHSCDTMQRLSDIWAHNVKEDFHDTVVLPVAMEKGEKYLVKELERFKMNVESYAGEILEETLRESVRIYNENRELLQNLYEKRKKGHIPARLIDTIMRASMTMVKEEHTELLRKFLEEVEVQEDSRPRLFVTGSVVLDPEILDVVEEHGFIKNDDFCTGSRYLEKVEEPSLEGIARRYARMWCPCRASGSRVEYILEKCSEYSVQGVVLLLHKFCEPYFFESVHLRNSLKERGYPTLLLEMQDQPLEQMRTRIEAFCELLEG